MNRYNNLQVMKNELNRKYEEKEITVEEYVEELPLLHNKIIETSDYMKDYLKISEQFPHLTLKEIIDFEEKLKENGGVLKTHSGKFMFDVRKIGMNFHTHSRSMEDVHYVAWDCCRNACRRSNSSRFPELAYYPPNSTGAMAIQAIFQKYIQEHARVRRLEELNVCEECKERGFKGHIYINMDNTNACTHVPRLNISYPVNNASVTSLDAVHLKNPNPITNFCDFPMNFSLKKK
jgi:hypothetical protein